MSNNRRRRRGPRLPEQPLEVTIESLSDEGRGIAHVDGRPVFIDQALPGERVLFKYSRLTSKVAEGRTVEILQAAADRVKPACRVYEVCGGCSLQHMHARAQLEMKQRSLLKQLASIAKIEPDTVIEPLAGPELAYRNKARLGVRYVEKKARVLVGFRERASSYITDTERCEILHPRVGPLIGELAGCISRLQLRSQIPQIEVAVGDSQAVLVFRHLEQLPQSDQDLLVEFAQQHDLTIMLQPGKPDALVPLWPVQPEPLFYCIDEFDIRIEFEPSDFTQINSVINQRMVSAAVDFLELDVADRVLDLFSGLGNFTLPIARRCDHVVGVEGSLPMVQKARHNALINRINNAEFQYADLYSNEVADTIWVKKRYNKILLDPPRSGAAGMLGYIGRMKAEKIVYVSCHPATLARDAGVLVNELGYRLVRAGVMDMFPHTAHVESIAVFEKR
jgi:23S rRNA (uracil1939-C5)-methyltransferase